MATSSGNVAEQIARGLEKAKRQSDGSWRACCPAHDDKNPSLSISNGKNDTVLVHCHAGCSQEDVFEALTARGQWNTTRAKHDEPVIETQVSPVPEEVNRPNFRTLLKEEPSAVYEYRTCSGQLIGFIARVDSGEGKTLKPVTLWRDLHSKSRWKLKGFDKPRPLFGLETLTGKPSARVVVVEGEKTALAGRSLYPDYCVITWQGGTRSVAHADWSPLEGRDVIVIPDNDDPGRKAVQQAASLLRESAASVAVVSLPENLPEKWDIADDWPEGLEPSTLLDRAETHDPTLARFAVSVADLVKLELPEREFIVDPFISTSSLAMVAAERGIGKTWFVFDLARSIAAGIAFLAYEVPEQRRVLIVDGEMPLVVIQERLKHLGLDRENGIEIIAAEMLFHEATPINININVEADQALLTGTLEQLEREGRRPVLIIFDNISSLGGGIDENDNSALEEQLQFLIRLRHMGYAVLLVHHTGKSGDQRGASRREDLLDTSIKLVKPEDGTGGVDGAEFEVHFTKTRGETPRPPKLSVKLREDDSGILQFLFETKHDARPHHHTLLRVFEGTGGKGPWRAFKAQKELVDVLDLSKGAVSKHLTKLRKADLISDRGQSGILITDRGVETLKRIFGELHGGPHEDKIVKARHRDDPDELGKTF